MEPVNYPIAVIKNDFPILKQTIYNKPLVYLDNGATTQKPQCVIDALDNYYKTINSNVHRGVHYLSQQATDAHEEARRTVQSFINAADDKEIIFTRGTTDSINIVAYSFAKQFIREGDEIIISAMEHHSNIVPWQIACEDRGGILKVIPLLPDGTLDIEALPLLISEKTKIIAVTWVSNALGTINPIEKIITIAHAHGIPVMLDAAQAIQHMKVDVQALDIDFLVFSGHKIYGPTGIGVLYGKKHWLQQMPPYQGGGSMIKTVNFKHTTYADLPFKFEAGTPHIAGTIGLSAALKYVNEIGIDNISSYEHQLMDYLLAELTNINEVRIIGSDTAKAGAISFNVGSLHPFDLGELMDKMGIAVRTGHHCCQPIMDYFAIPGTLRVSIAMYNTKSDIDAMIVALKKAIGLLM